MQHRHCGLFLLSLILSFSAFATSLEIAKTPTFIDPQAITLETIAAPPAANSEAFKRDTDIILWEQNTRTYYDLERAFGSVTLEPSYFNQALNARFEEARFPKLYQLMKAVMAESKIYTDAYKIYYKRPRPYQDNKDIKPAIPIEESYSYPSGHGTRGMTLALVFAELFPAKRDALLKTGYSLGQDRVIGGVHYPSDIEGAVALAQVVAKNIIASDAFKAKVKDAQDEIAQIKGM
ncbi:MAG: phosphatase PAP2 family protein [Gammaproteobacteria bacterium]|jgi:acid phosphatase (class A)